jgi:hypothetical protein
MAGKINRTLFRTTVTKAFKRSAAKNIAYDRAKVSFDRRKKRLLGDFKNHPVSREIEAGPSSSNFSGTLGGYGNLYSFIGFPGGNPVAEVYNLLQDSIRLRKTPVVRVAGSRMYFTFKGTVPDKRELEATAPMPWEPGSWLFRIETGISGLGSYLYGKMYAGSRSGTGIQSRKAARSGAFTPVPYMSTLLANFKKQSR